MLKTGFRLINTIAMLLLVGWFIAGCSDSNEKTTSSGESFTLSVGQESYTLSPRSDETPEEESPEIGTLSVIVKNIGGEDIEVDVWLEVLQGIHFEKGSKQTISDEGQRVTRSGVIMRPSESRNLEFIFKLDKEYDAGMYVIEVKANSSNEDVVTIGVNVEVK